MMDCKSSSIVKILDILPLVEERFDVKIKYLYARDLRSGIVNSIYKDIYREHLRVWNKFYEKEPAKNSFKYFNRAFREILRSIKTNGFSAETSLVPVEKNIFYPVNGGHRLAACLLYNKPVYIKLGEYPYKILYNENFFRKKGLSEEIISIVKNEIINPN